MARVKYSSLLTSKLLRFTVSLGKYQIVIFELGSGAELVESSVGGVQNVGILFGAPQYPRVPIPVGFEE